MIAVWTFLALAAGLMVAELVVNTGGVALTIAVVLFLAAIITFTCTTFWKGTQR